MMETAIARLMARAGLPDPRIEDVGGNMGAVVSYLPDGRVLVVGGEGPGDYATGLYRDARSWRGEDDPEPIGGEYHQTLTDAIRDALAPLVKEERIRLAAVERRLATLVERDEKIASVVTTLVAAVDPTPAVR